MTATLPNEVREAFSRFITCEYTTVDSRQQPITWPVTPYYSPGEATIDVTTGLGYPKKADDAARNPPAGERGPGRPQGGDRRRARGAAADRGARLPPRPLARATVRVAGEL